MKCSNATNLTIFINSITVVKTVIKFHLFEFLCSILIMIVTPNYDITG